MSLHELPYTPESSGHERLQHALALLIEGHECASDLKQQTWEFAVEGVEFARAGVSRNLLRWLVCKGYVEHAVEVVQPDQQGRKFRPSDRLCFSRRSCFVITPSGVELARQHLLTGKSEAVVSSADPERLTHANPLLPCWDEQRRELRLEGEVVKKYKRPAPNQELILQVFQEEGWPPRIDDPLPIRSDRSPRIRLHDTINQLNQAQKVPRIRFRGDGTGQGVFWEACS